MNTEIFLFNISVMDQFLSKPITYLLYTLLALVYISGLFIVLMENDSAQHATMAMHMYLENDFTNLIKGVNDYLDKPHMHFWLAALSFKIFGVSHWAYRIPALLFTILGAYSCFQLAKTFYGKKSAHLASLIFLSAQAVILSNHDVRTDAVLTGASIFSIWQLVLYVKNNTIKSIILGCIGLGIAFSTKGQLAVFMIGSYLLCHILYTRKWSAVLNWKVILGLIVFLITCSPLFYAYYMQFDAHPEKVINGQTGVSGIKFILWDQSFNRLTGTGFAGNNTDYFFFFHTLLWAFLPWAILAYFGIFGRSYQFIKNKFKYKNNLEFLTVGGFWLIMIIINTSKSKLPHYMNSMFPLVAVLLAGYLAYLFDHHKTKILKIMLTVQYFIIGIGSILAIILLTQVFGVPSTLLSVIYILLLALLIYFIYKKQHPISKIMTISVLFSVFLNFGLNTTFYRKLLKYQAGIEVLDLMKKHDIEAEDIIMIDNSYSWPLIFYTQTEIAHVAPSNIENQKGKWLFIYDRDRSQISDQNIEWQQEYEIPYYRVTMLSLPFLNPKTRAQTLKKAYLLKITE